MKLNAIHLTNFRSARDLTIPTNAPRVLICGRNHAGKSSVKEAIRWALLNRASVTDQRGVGAEKLIPTGETTAAVTLEIDGLGGVNRTFGPATKAFAVTGLTGDSAIQNAVLLADRLKTTGAFVDAVLDTGRFLNLHHIDAKALILELLDVSVEVDGVKRTLDELDALYKEAFDDRKATKAKVRTFSLKPLPQSPVPTGQPPTVEAISVQLTKLRGLLEAATGAAGETSGKRKVLTQQLELAKAFVPFTADISRADAVSQETGVEKAIAELEQAFVPSDPVPAVKEALFYAQSIKNLVEHQPKTGCVMSKDIPCETAKAKFTAVAKALQAKLDALPTVEVPVSGESPLVQARKRLQSLRVLVAKYDQSAVMERAHAETVDRLTKELAALPQPSGDEGEIANLRQRIQTGETLQTASRAYWTALYAHQESLKAQEDLTKQVDALEARCELLGPKGSLRVDALNAAFGKFEEAVNVALKPYGWHIVFEADPWGMTVNDRPVETYSESEQYLIGLAIQLAIADLSGLSFAVVDRLDVLDIGQRTIATKILLGCPLEQVFVLATREPTQPLKPVPGMISHRLVQVDGWTRIEETVR